MRLLLIDDSHIEFLTLARMLRKCDGAQYYLEWAASTAAGLAAFQSDSHDLYFVDFRLGPDSGLDLIHQVRRSGIIKPIIVLTGHDSAVVDNAAMAAGANDYLVKGEFDPVLLERAMRYATRNAATHAELNQRLLESRTNTQRLKEAAVEQVRAAQRERLLMAELDHRVKNMLAAVQAMIMHSEAGAPSLPAFTTRLASRIQAMARAHCLLSQSRWQAVSLASLVHEELAPYAGADTNLSTSGPTILLAPKAALALSLALHELATNAAKYGALSVRAADLAVTWSLADDTSLHLIWREQGGPATAPPTQRGFGSSLIERALELETGGRSRLEFRPEGLRCTIELPPSSMLPAVPPSAPLPPSAPAASSSGRVLVAEDSALVLMLLEKQLPHLGWTVVGPATRLRQALDLAETESFDAALLDVNLDGELAWHLAARLQDRGIPFAFITGYDAEFVLPQRFAHVAVVKKPFDLTALKTHLATMATP
jgi:two-component sensor histidine kinase